MRQLSINIVFFRDKPRYSPFTYTLLASATARVVDKCFSQFGAASDKDIVEVASEAMIKSPRRRSSSLVVFLCVVVVVADFTRHHSAAASVADVTEKLAKFDNEDLDNDEKELFVAAQGKSNQACSCSVPIISASALHVRIPRHSAYYYWGELSCSALPVALPFHLTELRKLALSTENPVTVQVVVVSKCFW